MSLNSQKKKFGRRLLVGGMVCMATFGVFSSCSDGYDLDQKEPSWLGSSVYAYLQEQGTFTNYLKLIDDLGEKEMLSHTGSKTIFPANDEAFAKFYASNRWGVGSYSQLSTAQKKMLLYSSIIDNPYQLQTLSSVEGPLEGECMRRVTSSSIYDSVLVVSTSAEEIPDNGYWTSIKQTQDKIVLFKDASGAAPMVHFIDKFLNQNLVTNTDVDFLYNDPAGTRQPGQCYVNDAKVTKGNVVCKNGYVHEVDKVIVPLDNMAEIVRTNPNTQLYSSLIERFAAPYYTRALTEEYNRIYGTSYDSVYQKRYFSKRSQGSSGSTTSAWNQDKNGNPVPADELLRFDPGWNLYNPNAYNDRNPVMEDMGVMLVPTDEAMNEWWNNGGGKVIKDFYQTWENVPNSVIVELLNNNMLNSFVGSVPSKFEDVVNDASLKMGLTTDNVEEVILGSNGAVYVTNEVFPPSTYSSVMFPTLVNENMNIMKRAIQVLDFDAYLNSMDAYYSFFIPTNEGLLTYFDPVSLGQSATRMWKFHYDNTQGEGREIYADVFEVQKGEDGSWQVTDSITQVRASGGKSAFVSSVLGDRLQDMLDNCIVIGNVEAGGVYYQTKGNEMVKVGGQAGVAGSMTVQGGWQIEEGKELVVKEIYDMTGTETGMGNGKSYIIDAEPVMSARRSVADVLAENPDFSEFFQLLQNCGALATSYAANSWYSVSPNGNLIYVPEKGNTYGEIVNYLLNSYHYTVYCPTNAAMEEAYAAGLPDTTAYRLAEESGDADSLYHVKNVMLNFVKYHIQDHSIFIDQNSVSGKYETDKTNPNGGRFYTLRVTVDGNGIELKDQLGNTQTVNKDKMYNVMAREYWNNQASISNSTQLTTSSMAVLHAIDHPLRYSKNQFIYQKVEIDDGSQGEEEE